MSYKSVLPKLIVERQSKRPEEQLIGSCIVCTWCLSKGGHHLRNCISCYFLSLYRSSINFLVPSAALVRVSSLLTKGDKHYILSAHLWHHSHSQWTLICILTAFTECPRQTSISFFSSIGHDHFIRFSALNPAVMVPSLSGGRKMVKNRQNGRQSWEKKAINGKFGLWGAKKRPFKTTRVFSDLLFHGGYNGATPVALRGRQRVQNGRQSWKRGRKRKIWTFRCQKKAFQNDKSVFRLTFSRRLQRCHSRRSPR